MALQPLCPPYLLWFVKGDSRVSTGSRVHPAGAQGVLTRGAVREMISRHAVSGGGSDRIFLSQYVTSLSQSTLHRCRFMPDRV